MQSVISGAATLSAIVLLLGPGSSLIQEAPKSAAYQTTPEGIFVKQLLSDWTAQTGRKFVTQDDPRILQRRLALTGSIEYAAVDADYAFESMLASADLALLPAGPKGSNLYVVEDVGQPRSVKSRARYVPSDKLADLARHPAQVFVTSIALKHVPADQVRSGVQMILVNRNVELAMDVPGANALMIIGFGPTLATIGELVATLDVPPPDLPVKKANSQTEEQHRK